MFGLIITYDFIKSIHDDRLREAEQARLIKTVKTVSTPIKSEKRRRRFSIKKMFAAKVNKNDVSTYSSYDHHNI